MVLRLNKTTQTSTSNIQFHIHPLTITTFEETQLKHKPPFPLASFFSFPSRSFFFLKVHHRLIINKQSTTQVPIPLSFRRLPLDNGQESYSHYLYSYYSTKILKHKLTSFHWPLFFVKCFNHNLSVIPNFLKPRMLTSIKTFKLEKKKRNYISCKTCNIISGRQNPKQYIL